MSIKHKLLLSYSAIVLILIGISIYSIFQILHINKEYSTLMDERVYKVMEAREIQNGTSLQGLYLRSYVLRQSDKDLEMFLESRETALKNLEEIAPLFNNEEMQEQIQIIQEKQELYNQYSDKVIDHIKKGETGQALNTLFNYAYPANGAIQEAINHIVQYETEQMNVTQKSVTSGIEQSIILLIGIAIAATVMSIILAFFIIRNITVPLKQLTNASRVIASGNLHEADIVVKTKDEIYDLAQSFNSMKQNLAKLISNVAASISRTTVAAEQLAASTNEITLASQEVANTVETLATNGAKSAQTGQECADATDDTANGISRIAEATQLLNERAINTETIATEGKNSLQTVEQQMMVIQKSSYETWEKIKQLSQHSAEIEQITKAITEITEQTNLLALNAAIEAARAGEHGRGFAIVAQEIRKPAEESKNSAEKIIGLATQIQSGTKTVEESVNISVQNVDQGVSYLQEAGASFQSIFDAISDMSKRIEEISTSVEEITAGTQEVAAAVSEMAHLAKLTSEQSDRVYASIEEQTASLNEINEVANALSEDALSLKEEIKQFKL